MTESVSPQLITQHTKAWLSEFIIAHNICPFARREYERNSIHYEIFEGSNVKQALSQLIEMCQKLDSDSDIEAVLFIMPTAVTEFNSFLDLLDMANELMFKQDYEGTYQLASFHPDYCFEGVDDNDASHYTNRSPYPMLHIIREAELEKTLEKYPNPEAIPERNISYCQEMGTETLENILLHCKSPK